MAPDVSPRFGGIRDAHVASRDEEGRVRRRRRGNQSPPTSPIPSSSSSSGRCTDGERVRQEHDRDPRRVSVGTRRSTPDRCRDRSVGDGMNGMNARGACVVEGWEYDKYSVSCHHTATSSSVTPDCSKDSLLKSRLGDLGPRSARRDLVEGRVRNLTPRARGTPRVATFGPRDRCAPVKGRARSVTRGR